MKKNDLRYFELAKNASKFSTYKRYHIGAVLVYKNKIISVGFNIDKENPLQKEYNKLRGLDTDSIKNSLHAEMMCILRAKKMEIDFSKCSIYVFREYRNGTIAVAKPCNACMQAIKDIGIRDVYYTGDGSYVYERIGVSYE